MTDANFICTRCDEPCEESEVNEKGECPECAEELAEDGLNEEAQSEEEFEANSEHDDEPEHCSMCNGTGEGMVDGSRCRTCGGSGVIRRADPDDFDPPDSDDFSDKDFGPYGYSDE